ncbi:MAG: radical SAM family heme chaperone HemW [Firmicutes bacterium]|nr:radical SAM family heme chaperone HemW [Bacillota bacterium]MCL5039120.1 radical SAM family heme chaperone HemW [Bacillota bacterium]
MVRDTRRTSPARGRGELSLYFHFPFCLRKCHYCDFLSFPLAEAPVTPPEYLTALQKELSLYARFPWLTRKSLRTIYFGGGTPSLAPAPALNRLLERIRQGFPVDPAAEITLEANPGTVDRTKLVLLREAGWNRLSLGAQVFDDRLLARLGRAHDMAAIQAAFRAARQAGFANINLDLIFGLPEQDREAWRKTLREAVALGPEHVSAYPLAIEPGTSFDRFRAAGQLPLPDEEVVLDMWEEAIERLAAAGYQHYEISNYARPGYRSRHNLTYWQTGEYLGLGLGSHSCLDWPQDGEEPGTAAPGNSFEAGSSPEELSPAGGQKDLQSGEPGPAASGQEWAAKRRRRFSNHRKLRNYLSDLENGRFPLAEVMVLPDEDIRSEAVIMGLRLLEGIDLVEFARRFQMDLEQAFPGKAEHLRALGLVEIKANHLRLTKRGLFLANQVMAEFV